MKRSSLYKLVGICCITLALGIIFFNLYEDYKISNNQKIILESYDNKAMEKDEVEIPDYLLNPDMDMPEIKLDGYDFIGILEIPAIDLRLPVLSSWSDDLSKVAPCRYYGSVYLNNIVIASHNSRAQFGSIKKLNVGDDALFYDNSGNVFEYKLVASEIISGDSAEKMISGKWPLTLFTCTYDNLNRYTLRFDYKK